MLSGDIPTTVPPLPTVPPLVFRIWDFGIWDIGPPEAKFWGYFGITKGGTLQNGVTLRVLQARRRREKIRGYMGSSKGETRRRRENFAILGSLNGDFTRENG